ncbi:uncharacterized protein LOC6568884 [Drosophila grimshawi]|uniref:GH22763 n=1 Tax=Drosophila grimshawi TaxID=7222 RepID=B4JWC5_DROGR|nr:uncharacterized protein LOC6568884 [Drosophila grimshawi]EDV98263.1 GH22763 [Drosophila grimshawi]
MASIINAPQAQGIAEAIPAWKKFDWSSDIQHDIYRDWGKYYFNRRRENMATHYYTQALTLDESDYMTLYQRSKALRVAAQIERSLKDARNASAMASKKMGPNAPINLQICDALFDLNEFEQSMAECFDNTQAFVGVKSEKFESRFDVVNDVIKDVTGKSMSLFYLKNSKLIARVREINKAKEIIDDRPRWKILRDLGKCDILSIPEVEEEILSPLEIARRARAFNVIHQTYLNDSWADVLFMKQLSNNPNLLLDQCKRSKNFLNALSHRQYDIVRQFMKMLQSRNPLYHVSYLKFPNRKMLEMNKQAYLFRIQYQTHRNMIANLREIRRLRNEGRVKSLSQYIEKIMGDYYVTKTNRVMCWKFEFINEVYNTMALALCEQYRVPKNFRYHPLSMYQLLLLPADKLKDVTAFVFGDRSTYQDGDVQDPVAANSRKLIVRMERRILFAKYSIEKCYLLHQIANVHLTQGRYDECCLSARKAVEEAHNCNSLLWTFLSYIQVVKANTVQHKVEKTKEALDKAIPIAQQLKNPDLIKFMEVCKTCNEEDTVKKQSIVSSRRNSKPSINTSNNEDDDIIIK